MKALATGWLLALAVVAGCSKKQDRPPPPEPVTPAIPAVELKRGQDACAAYVARVCTCAETVPTLADRCSLAKALPEAIEVAMQVGMSTDSTRKDTLHAADVVRKSVAQCIEQTARLPGLGCP